MACPLHRNIGGQKAVGAAHPGRVGPLGMGVEVHHLHQAVYAGVGAARAQGGDALGGELPQGFFQLVLHGAPGELALPALVGLAVVGHAQGDADVATLPGLFSLGKRGGEEGRGGRAGNQGLSPVPPAGAGRGI